MASGLPQSLTFNFSNYTDRYWILESAVLLTMNGTSINMTYKSPPASMETPSNYSFACTSSVFQAYNLSIPRQKIQVIINEFQVS